MTPDFEPTNRIDPAEVPAESQIGGLSLLPVAIIAVGAPATPVERLIALQSAIARFVGLLTSVRMPRFRLPRTARPAGWPRHIF